MSKIEQLIDELEEYIENCPTKLLSNDIICVNKEEIDELIRELRLKVPEEIKRCQKIISNKEEILQAAEQKANQLVMEAAAQTSELISESDIMQQAYARANEIVELATKQAQEILDNAMTEANAMKDAAVTYTDDMLGNVQTILEHSMEVAEGRYKNLMIDLQRCNEIVVNNRAELAGNPVDKSGANNAPADSGAEGSLDNLDLI